MPYIKDNDRAFYGNIDTVYPENPGDLNYCITSLCANYWKQKTQNYKTINDIIGALEGAKLEFYRRVAVPYEDKKIVQNGDVY